MSVIIACDSASDITTLEASKLNLKQVHFKVAFGNENFIDGVDLDNDTFYKRLKESQVFPKTSLPSPDEYVKIFEEAKKNNDEVVFLSISSKLSGAYQACNIAKDIADYDKIHIIDTKNCLTGLRLLVLNAVKLRDEGKSAEEIVNVIEDIKKRVHIFSIVTTLEYFFRGGRLSKAKYLVGQALNIKPFIKLSKEGEIVKDGQALGMIRAFMIASNQYKKFPIEKEYGLCYGYTTNENLEKFIQKTNSGLKMEEYDISQIGPTSGSHIGLGGVCMAYISTKENE